MAESLAIRKRVNKQCVVCSKTMKVILYTNKKYRGGHYFGKIPLISKEEWKRVNKAGTHQEMFMGEMVKVLNRDPKPHGYGEHWECPKCYWRK